MCRPLALLALLAVLAGVVQSGLTASLDRGLLDDFAGGTLAARPLHDLAAVLLSPVGAPPALALGVALWWLARRRGRRDANAWLAALLVSIAVEAAGKLLVDQIEWGPPKELLGIRIDSFPSGHMARAIILTAFAGSLWRRARPALAAWLLFAPFGLLVLQMHTLTDVLGGALLGTALVDVVRRGRGYEPRKSWK